jgi:riboflavin kinase / FMN adenylyltransferase
MWLTSDLEKILTPTAVALGNFDGVHDGHKQVVKPVLNLPTGVYPTVVTFNPHPREFFSGKPRQLLTPIAEKVHQLSLLGVRQLVLLPFDRELAMLTPEDFVNKILIEHLQAQTISVGEDFCFGRNRSGTAEDLRAIASIYNISVNIVPLHKSSGERISSSRIRTALQQGDLDTVNRLLGRNYTLTGMVIQGQQLGRTIGFPTANLDLDPNKILPQKGVYAVYIHIGEQEPMKVAGVMNIGTRPTVKGKNLSVEVHLFNWNHDLYGQTLTVSLEKFLRPEKKFDSIKELKVQIQIDCENAEKYLFAGCDLIKNGHNEIINI